MLFRAVQSQECAAADSEPQVWVVMMISRLILGTKCAILASDFDLGEGLCVRGPGYRGNLYLPLISCEPKISLKKEIL